MVITDNPQNKNEEQISMHLMSSGQLNLEVSKAHFEETNKLKYETIVTDFKEREKFQFGFKSQVANTLNLNLADVNILGIQRGSINVIYQV